MWLEAFFYGCKIKVDKSITEKNLVESGKIGIIEETQQYNAKNLNAYLNFNFKKLKKDALSLLALTDLHLYNDGFDHVSGQACPVTNCGVSSIYRFLPSFTEYQYDTEEDAFNYILFCMCKNVTHELGHTFGLLHCTYYECCMNGTNNPDERHARPPYFCPVCLRKLNIVLGFDYGERYKKLAEVCQKLQGHFSEFA